MAVTVCLRVFLTWLKPDTRGQQSEENQIAKVMLACFCLGELK